VSLVGILLYVAFRFETGFGVGALLSTIHDVLVVIGLFVLFGREFSAPMVAAILLIIGYSINDTIVVFDRIREELVLSPGLKLYDVINRALNVTLQRTIVTGVTTLSSATLLFVYGSGPIEDLAFTFIVGILFGTFSSVYIASPIFYWYHKGRRDKLDQAIVEEAPKYDWETGAKPAAR
jgi:SecD/SecF fusion protein